MFYNILLFRLSHYYTGAVDLRKENHKGRGSSSCQWRDMLSVWSCTVNVNRSWLAAQVSSLISLSSHPLHSERKPLCKVTERGWTPMSLGWGVSIRDLMFRSTDCHFCPWFICLCKYGHEDVTFALWAYLILFYFVVHSDPLPWWVSVSLWHQTDRNNYWKAVFPVWYLHRLKCPLISSNYKLDCYNMAHYVHDMRLLRPG